MIDLLRAKQIVRQASELCDMGRDRAKMRACDVSAMNMPRQASPRPPREFTHGANFLA